MTNYRYIYVLEDADVTMQFDLGLPCTSQVPPLRQLQEVGLAAHGFSLEPCTEIYESLHIHVLMVYNNYLHRFSYFCLKHGNFRVINRGI